MSTPPDISPGQLSLAQARAALAHSKHGLLTWADATDARTRAARATVARTAARGIIASLGALLAFKLFRSLRPGRAKPATPRATAAPSTSPSHSSSPARGINWASAARVGIWAFPHALRLWQHHTQQPPASSPPPAPPPPRA